MLSTLVSEAEVGIVRRRDNYLRALFDRLGQNLIVNDIEANVDAHRDAIHVEDHVCGSDGIVAGDETNEVRRELRPKFSIRYIFAEWNRVALVVNINDALPRHPEDLAVKDFAVALSNVTRDQRCTSFVYDIVESGCRVAIAQRRNVGAALWPHHKVQILPIERFSGAELSVKEIASFTLVEVRCLAIALHCANPERALQRRLPRRNVEQDREDGHRHESGAEHP